MSGQYNQPYPITFLLMARRLLVTIIYKVNFLDGYYDNIQTSQTRNKHLRIIIGGLQRFMIIIFLLRVTLSILVMQSIGQVHYRRQTLNIKTFFPEQTNLSLEEPLFKTLNSFVVKEVKG